MQNVPKLYSSDIRGVDACLVCVEADLHVGLHAFQIVGLADKAVSEAKDRVNSALKHADVKPPSKENRRITINLAPADIKKTGARFDLPIALAYLLASEQINPFTSEDKLFLGELSLDGTLRPVSGVLASALLARERGIATLFVPKDNASEAALVKGISVIPVESLTKLIEHLEGARPIRPQPLTQFSPAPASSVACAISEIKGQLQAKRALLVSAAGGHHLFLSGPPGTGKTMLAGALASLLPPPTLQEALATTRIYSGAGLLKGRSYINFRPFRAPHHGASSASLLGGGSVPRPGEISLAHTGVLFLDEAPEFRRDALEGLRQPLEAGEVSISRSRESVSFPSRFLLVLAMNPCPCGHFEEKGGTCRCSGAEVHRYQRKISGPLLDRVDIHMRVPRVPIEELRALGRRADEDARFKDQVLRARATQVERFARAGLPHTTNTEMSSKEVDELVRLTDKGEDVLRKVLQKSLLSARGYYRILKTARTIADLDDSADVCEPHLAEAFQYRLKTRE